MKSHSEIQNTNTGIFAKKIVAATTILRLRTLKLRRTRKLETNERRTLLRKSGRMFLFRQKRVRLLSFTCEQARERQETKLSFSKKKILVYDIKLGKG